MFQPIVAMAAVALASALPPLAPAPAAAQAGPHARIWVEGEREVFRSGERVLVRFTTGTDAHVAVLHIDTDGRLDFLYPSSPWDDGWVRGGRVYSVPQSGYSSWSVRSRPGIGYLYIIASQEPLDFSYFGGQFAPSWDWSYAGRTVRGDPFLALEQITRALLPDWRTARYSVDYYSYHVGSRHSYPAYACGSSGWGHVRGWGWSSQYGSCDGLSLFLRQHPGYYDTRLYRRDRRAFLGAQELPEVRHGYKAPADGRSGSRTVVPYRGSSAPAPATGRAGPQGASPPAEQPSRRRPTLERRGSGTTAAPPAAPRTRGSSGTREGPAQPKARDSRGGGGGGYIPARSSPASPRARPAPGGGEASP